MDILDKIDELLYQKKCTQRQLSAFLGVNENVYSKWKSGTSKSYMKYIDRIADFLEVSADYLLGNKKSSDIKSELDKICINLSPADKEKVVEYARLLANREQK